MGEDQQKKLLSQHITVPTGWNEEQIKNQLADTREISEQQVQEDISEAEIWEQYQLVKAQFENVLRMLAEQTDLENTFERAVWKMYEELEPHLRNVNQMLANS